MATGQNTAIDDWKDYDEKNPPKTPAQTDGWQDYAPAQLEEINEKTLPGSTGRLRSNIKTFTPPKKIERETTGKGISTEGMGGEIWEGAKNLGGGILSLIDPTRGLSGAALTKLGVNPRSGDVSERLGEIPIVGAAREAKAAYQDPRTRGLDKATDTAIAPIGSLVGMSSQASREAGFRGEGGKVLGQTIVPVATTIAGAAGSKVIPKLSGVVDRMSTAEEPAVAAQRALRPPAKFAERTQQNITGAGPYLEGARNLKELQAKVPAAKTEVWHPYKEALSRVGDNEVAAPKLKVTEDGGLEARSPEESTISINDLEKERLKASALQDKVRKLRPIDQQGILQKQGQEAQIAEHYKDILSRLDPELEAAGVDPKKIREVHGNIKGIEKLIAGKNTLTEVDRSYGIGKLIKDIDVMHPFRNLPLVREAAGDIAAGRPWFKGKPTDVAVNEGFNAGASGRKPNLIRPIVEHPEIARLPAPATEMPGPVDLGEMTSEERQGGRWVTPKAALQGIQPIQPQFLREIRPERQEAPIKGLLPSGEAPETTIPPIVEEPFAREEVRPLASSAERAPETQLGPMGRAGLRQRIRGLLPNMSAEGERAWFLVRQTLDMLESADRPGRYYAENEPGEYNLKPRSSEGTTRGGHWYGVKSMRNSMPWLRDTEFTPEDLRSALRQFEKTGKENAVMRSAMKYVKSDEYRRLNSVEEREPGEEGEIYIGGGGETPF